MLQKDLFNQLHAELDANHVAVATEVRALDAEQLARHPIPGKWSVAEVLEHLTLMDGLFLPAMEPLIRTGRPDAAAPSRNYRESFLGKRIAAALEKPEPLKSPKAAAPLTPRAGVVEAFLAGDARYLALLEAARSLDWNAIRLRPPVAPWLPIKINIGDTFRIHVVHVRRHLAQIGRIKAAL